MRVDEDWAQLTDSEPAVTDPPRRTLHDHNGNGERGDSVETDGGNIHEIIDRLEDDMADIRAEFERLRRAVLTLTGTAAANTR